MARTPEQAITWGNAQVNGSAKWSRLCLSFVRQALGLEYTPASAWPNSERNAGRAWDRAKRKHPTSDANSIPRGLPVFWETPGEADHIALSLGNGLCLSNDFKRPGHIDVVRIADISNKWGRLLGWTEDLVGNDLAVKTPTDPPRPTPGGLRIDGVDVSHHQARTLDWQAARRAGVRFAWLKATEGETWTDDDYQHFRQAATVAGVVPGAYHFARPDGADAVREAQHFLRVAKPQPGELLPVLDLETRGPVASRAALTRWVGAWVGEVERQLGVKPVIYTSDRFPLDDAFGCLLWVPRYSNDNAPPRIPAPWKRWDIWQFSNGVYGRPNSVAGLGHVDLNTMRDGLTVADLTIPTTQEDDMPTADDIAKAILEAPAYPGRTDSPTIRECIRRTASAKLVRTLVGDAADDDPEGD